MDEHRVRIIKDGPYLIWGISDLDRLARVLDAAGAPVGWEQATKPPFHTDSIGVAHLCRCGMSAAKPSCDGSHDSRGFDGTETADTTPYEEAATVESGHGIEMGEKISLCSHAMFCQRDGDVWHTLWDGDASPERVEGAKEAIDLCPSGRLRRRAAGESGWPEHGLEPAVVLEKNGPIMLRGHVTVERSDGVVMEFAEQMTLCRCGRSQNKPLCDGSHVRAGFTDEPEA